MESGVVEPAKAKMRAGQLWRWIHHAGVRDFSAMSNVGKDLQAALAAAFTLERPEVVERQVSRDGTRKWLIRLGPGIEVETVYIPDVGRAGALCVSSQVGCTLNCTFCHTGTQPLVRNLTAAEIVAQVQVAKDDLEEWPSDREDRRLSNVVFMGMGEPLYNLDNVARAIEVISDGEGIALSRRRITVSTSGVVPELTKLGDDHPGDAGDLPARHQRCAPRRAGAPEPEVSHRRLDGGGPRLSWDFQRRRVTFEYVMLKGVNDSPAEAGRWCS